MAWRPAYASVRELAARCRLTDTSHDDRLAIHLEAASRSVDRFTNRQFGQEGTAIDRVVFPEWDRRRSLYVVRIEDLMTTTDLVVTDANGDTISAGSTGYTLEPRNAAADGRPWTQFTVASATDEMTVTALWGWSAVPVGIKAATLIEAHRLFWREQAPAGVAGSPDQGSEVRLLARLDPDAEKEAGPFKRWWGAT